MNYRHGVVARVVHGDRMSETKTNSNNPIGWFEIGTGDPEAARRFYGEAFGWTFEMQGPYSIITTGDGQALQGGIQDTREQLPEGTPHQYAVVCVEVSDTAAACERDRVPGRQGAGGLHAHAHGPHLRPRGRPRRQPLRAVHIAARVTVPSAG